MWGNGFFKVSPCKRAIQLFLPVLTFSFLLLVVPNWLCFVLPELYDTVMYPIVNRTIISIIFLTYCFAASDRMCVLQAEPNSFTFGGFIGACVNANALHRGKKYHALVIKYGLEHDTIVWSAIVNLHSKCGEINEAVRLFHSLPTKDLISWNEIVCRLARNRKVLDALNFCDEMCKGHKPNNATFIGVLTAYSHGGFIHRGLTYLNEKVCKYLIKPQAEHCAGVVDVLGLARLLKEAESTIQAMPFEPDVPIWSAVLGACKRYGNLGMAKRIAQKIVIGEAGDSSSHALVANMHSDNGDWNGAMDTWEVLRENGVLKVKGRSWIVLRGHVHCFASGYAPCTQLKPVHNVLHSLQLTMVDAGLS